MSELSWDGSESTANVLVLQGGGALASYQAGAYQVLHDSGLEPDWVAATSIGAINAAIIAGNDRTRRVDRLRQFWEMVSTPEPWMPIRAAESTGDLVASASAAVPVTPGVPGYFAPRVPPAALWPPGSPEAQSLYDTTPLKKTLEQLVDFDRINDCKMRLSVGAVGVTSGNFRYFDNYETHIGPEHIMASNAMPPGFPSISIEGEQYWDGSIASNTPLDYVMDVRPVRDLRIFQIDLYSSRGEPPKSIIEVVEREKSIRNASRTRSNNEKTKEVHTARRALRDLIGKLPDDLKNDPSVEILKETAKENTVTLVRLIYRTKDQTSPDRESDFSHHAMVHNWAAGVRDANTSLRHKRELAPPPVGELVSYDFTGDQDTFGADTVAKRVALLFATTREPSTKPNVTFSGERSDEVYYGKASVRIPANRRIGELNRPTELTLFGISIYKQKEDPDTHFILDHCEVLKKDAWLSEVASSRRDEAFIFVHGFNVSFLDSVYRCAQIIWDLGYEGLPVLFSWASRGNIRDYLYDQTSARMAGRRFVDLLEDLQRAGINKVHILAHSMGNFLVLNALSKYPLGASFKLGELLMAAPDVDRDEYTQMIGQIQIAAQGMTLYASSEDRALALSKMLSGNIARAGDVPPTGPIIVEHVDTIDVTVLGGDILGLNHGTFAESKSILNDVRRLLEDGKRPPHKRFVDLRGMPEGVIPPKWWRYIL